MLELPQTGLNFTRQSGYFNRNKAQIDPLLLWPILILLIFGLIMVYSASITTAQTSSASNYQAHYYLFRHAIYLLLGFISALAIFQLPVSFWQKIAPSLLLLGVLLLLAVLFFGKEANGAKRWLSLAGFQFQPAELMKFMIILYAADYTTRKNELTEKTWWTFMPIVCITIVIGVALLMQPDYGTFVIIATIVLSMLFLGGVDLRFFLLLCLIMLVGLAMLVWLQNYRLDRIATFLDPWQDPWGKGYQLTHSLMAFGRGEVFGVGLGASIEKLYYLPEAHTDFILAVIGEELGFIGVLVTTFLYLLIIQRSFYIGRQSIKLGYHFNFLLAQSIGIWLAIQTIISMGTNMGVLPPKGLTLPMLSYGGTSLITCCITLAVLLRCDYENRVIQRHERW